MNDHTSSELSEAFIALGANLGDREATLMEAIRRLDLHPDITVTRCSNLYETEPVGYLDQPDFVNMAISVRTGLTPLELLRFMLETEQQLGRERNIRWGPRTVDLDLLWMDGLTLDTPELTLPHPRMMERAFVLVPMKDIVGSEDSENVKGLRDSLHDALERLPEKKGICLWKTCTWRSASAPSEN
ncbi:2-amino-4-hydroxy-6-hydroxymethyldihydropteridine pyrophosphokinase [Paenibacillus yonginensis]|uniref:2-amino-4-hydroxy-6-hydroxymethyldihydropteridine diphosphokinase n=1 Tax=Paenibacillus yonginensis TaxID=1462996 RepID=A0A1B1N7C9_9BACL|nr:2-amino-4-hydroxy-6-hydroxymethyldihydropteridine diphosphokinase [Paenibacillus yonginensis]ANS77327.1 2-amino-4-hydroxy-6-hydroxymethyldihydropteridine pyrophosphokinase [Paenibacillus yonginensis]